MKVCSLPGYSKPCCIDLEHGHVHDCCGLTHASEHAATMNTGPASNTSGDKGSSSETQGLYQFQHTTPAHHGGSSTTQGEADTGVSSVW